MASVLFGVVLMVVTGCLRPGELQRAIRWGDPAAGLDRLFQRGDAKHRFGARFGGRPAAVAAGLAQLLGADGVFLLAQLFTETLTNGATVVLLSPSLPSWPKAWPCRRWPSSTPFCLRPASVFHPIGYQCNLMVMGPGRYRFFDMTRYGAPLTLGLTLLTPWLI